jgi:hypothetical protein
MKSDNSYLKYILDVVEGMRVSNRAYSTNMELSLDVCKINPREIYCFKDIGSEVRKPKSYSDALSILGNAIKSPEDDSLRKGLDEVFGSDYFCTNEYILEDFKGVIGNAVVDIPKKLPPKRDLSDYLVDVEDLLSRYVGDRAPREY